MEGGSQTLLIIRRSSKFLKDKKAAETQGTRLDKLPTKLRSERDRGVCPKGGVPLREVWIVCEGKQGGSMLGQRLHRTREGGCNCLDTFFFFLLSFIW